MAEVGLLPFARVPLEVSKAVVPRYRSRFSKHQCTQPQLLAILCLMHYEDWTLPGGGGTFGRASRVASGTRTGVPDFATLYRFLQRLDAINHRPSGRRNGTPVARHSPKRSPTSACRGRRNGFGARSSQHVLRAAAASSWAKAAALAALVELAWRIWISSFCCGKAPGGARGTTVPACPLSSKPLPSVHLSAWCWPTRNSTAKGIPPTFVSNSEHKV